MERTFFDVFKKYDPDESTRRILEKASNIRVRTDTERRMLEAYAFFPELIGKDDLYRIEEEIRDKYQLNGVRLFPSYPPELFSEDYLKEVIIELQRIGAVSRGFFEKYAAKIEGKQITVEVYFNDGGVNLLYDGKAPDLIAGIIYSEFGLEYKVQIQRVQGYTFDYEQYEKSRYDEDMKSLEAQILNAPPPKSADGNGKSGAKPSSSDKNGGKDAEKDDKPPLKRIQSLGGNEYIEPELISDNVYKVGNMIFDITDAKIYYGNGFVFEPTPLRNIDRTIKGVCVFGRVLASEIKDTRRGDKTIITFSLTDNDASINCKMVRSVEDAKPVAEGLANGDIIAAYGSVKTDTFDGDLFFDPVSIAKIKRRFRTDDAPEKRVELHLHTQLSAMDALITPEQAVETAFNWGHKAVAITDHGNVQAFPQAMEKAEKLGMKVIYGMEGYYVDDTARTVFGDKDAIFEEDEFVVFDIETTGLSALYNKITEIGAVLVRNGEVLDTFGTYADPEEHIPENITRLTGITDEMVKGAPSQADAVKAFLEFAGDRMLIAHNASFDTGFIRHVCEVSGMQFTNTYLDTVALSRYVNPDLQRHKLDNLAEYFGLGDFNHHRAYDDAAMLAQIFFKMTEKLGEEGLKSISAMNNAMADKVDCLKLPTNHIILLVKNKTGLKNLYKIVSRGYLDYYRKHPRLPKTILDEYRDGLIVSAACSEGELFDAILSGKTHDELVEIAKYYDYLEIHPVTNNRYLIEKGTVQSDDELRELNKKIVALGDEVGRPVVAVCDAHFLEKTDEVYRKILLAGMKFGDADRDCGLYFRTTQEMLDEFSYLGEEKAYEVVIKNTNMIADMIEEVRPIPKGTFTPNMEGAEENLTTTCENKAKRIYGDPLPEIVGARLSKELDSIIKHGFAVLYVIAQKLVSYSESQGYLVGSRGSVGSSLVAFMDGISEVNPLPPHYVCPKCKYSDFSNPDGYGSGYDMPDAYCPKCGEKMINDGHDIPFETFLGFYGDKSPDIDLNFSGEVQGKVHKYTEELFGSENVFRAGTLGTLADKTAYGFVAKYLESKGVSVNRAEMNRLVDGCVGVKRTTGQHPGGIIVVPREFDVYDFTPIQHPADDPTSSIVTTHFAFTYLHDTILKLDELGHDVPTKYKMIERFTNTSVMDVPMNDPDVYELFRSTKSLGASPEEIGSKLGTLGLPESGTGFVQPVILETKPKNFSDLLQISGLTHGTDVWAGNAQELIKNGICDISQVVGTRDGIMLTLIKYGVENSMAFKIMEMVRKNKKGKPIPDEMVEAMRAQNVPEWYIDSLRKIKYMFPKAHAAAYVMSAIRIGWYKVHMPLEFYAAFFSAAPDGVDAAIVMSGKQGVVATMEEITRKKKEGETTQKEEAMLSKMQLVNEAYARGIKFLPVDLEHSDAFLFLPENGKIRLPFSSLNGLGESAAQNIAEVRDREKILSVEDLRMKGQLNKSVIDILQQNGVLNGLSETNQITFF